MMQGGLMSHFPCSYWHKDLAGRVHPLKISYYSQAGWKAGAASGVTFYSFFPLTKQRR